MSIDIANETSYKLENSRLLDLAQHLITSLGIHPSAELSIALISDENMAELHQQWMDLPGTTDVMSFPMDELTPGGSGEHNDSAVLGDVVISPAVAANQAAAAGHSTEDEIFLLLTHGVLHLVGYDHDEAESKSEMFALQDALLSDFLGRPAPKATEI